jgi:pyoverdine/dityrosine biosynthesis protein Dit1
MTTDFSQTRVRLRILEAALPSLAEAKGLTPGLLKEATLRAGCTAEQARIFFKRDEELVLALYLRLAGELEARSSDLPAGPLSTRFAAAMEVKVGLMEPYRAALAALTASLMDPRHELGALSEPTALVRQRVMGVFAAVLHGATDRPPALTPARAEAAVRTLYAAHLGLLLLWTQDRSPGTQATRAALALACDLLALLGPALSVPELELPLARVDGILQPLLEPEPGLDQGGTAEAVLRTLFRHRRLHQPSPCAESPCPECLALHLPRVRRSVALGEPIHLLLPAFPAKSPSLRKVLGSLPDLAEEVGLRYLQDVCDRLAQIYPPGARVTICSDGRVFSDLVHVSDIGVTSYGREIRRLIEQHDLRSLDTFALEDLYEAGSFEEMRDQLCTHYAEPVASIERRSAAYPHHRALFNGIHRFLFEEHPSTDPPMSRTRLREHCKGRAYEVIRRSDAWGRLLAECFPTALRLSIHPQEPHSEKIGILLGEAADPWITPWHGVVVEHGGLFRLMKRYEAEALPGAVLISRDGRPSHFRIADRTGAAAEP